MGIDQNLGLLENKNNHIYKADASHSENSLTTDYKAWKIYHMDNYGWNLQRNW